MGIIMGIYLQTLTLREIIDKVRCHKRKVKFDFRLYHFFYSGVMALDMPKNTCLL
jgi:hypothetical protein